MKLRELQVEAWGIRPAPDDPVGDMDVLTNYPVSNDRIQDAMAELGIGFHQDLVRLYKLSNGLMIKSTVLVKSIDEIILGDDSLLSIRDWGNGDSDCLACLGDSPNNLSSFLHGAIYFCGHDPFVRAHVAPSLSPWLRGLCLDIFTFGFVRHPSEYTDNQVGGMYAKCSKM